MLTLQNQQWATENVPSETNESSRFLLLNTKFCYPGLLCCSCVCRSRKTVDASSIIQIRDSDSTSLSTTSNKSILELHLTPRTENVTKIVSASAVSTRAASRQITPRPTFSSESRLFYNTPPAEPYYLPPIENPTTVPSSVSTPPAINPTTPTSFKESTPNTPRSATSTIHLSNINGDSNSTKSLPLNFDETPIRVNPKNQEEKIIKATEFSDWNSTPQQSVDDNLSLDRFSVKQSSEDRDESFANQRMNFSAPAQADVQSIKSHESRLDSEENVDEPDLGSNNFVGIKSLPGSIVNLNSQIELETKPIVNLQRQKSLHVSSTTPRVSKQNLGKLRGRIPPPLSNRPQIQPLGVDINSNIGYNVKPFDRPKEALNLTLQQFESNEWETIMTALRNLIRLLRNHYDIVEIQMHTVAVALAKQIRNLRSQVARAACAVASEMFGVHKKSIEMEMEELAIPLLNRTADTNKFLRSDANAALDTMVLNMPSTRVVQILATKGATHQNAIVRCATARLLFNIVNRLGVEKIFLLPRETRDRVLLTGANLLTEGSLDTRNYAKQLFRTLLPYYNFQRIMLEVIPTSTMRNISKTLNSLKP